MDSVSGSDERAAGKLAATLKYIDEASEIEFVNLILAEAFVQNNMYRGAMEPAWTSGGAPRGWGLLVSLTLGACHTPTESCVVSH